MARMFPEEFPLKKGDEIHGGMEAEQKVFYLLKYRLPDDYECYYNYYTEGKNDENHRPDFIILLPKLGIAILEVKAWSRNYVVEIKENGKVCVKWRDSQWENPCPFWQVDGYRNDILSQFSWENGLKNDKGGYAVPVVGFVVFPNISRQELQDSASFDIEKQFPSSKTMTSENFIDFQNKKEHESGNIGDFLNEGILKQFKFPWGARMDQQEIRDAIKNLLKDSAPPKHKDTSDEENKEQTSKEVSAERISSDSYNPYNSKYNKAFKPSRKRKNLRFWLIFWFVIIAIWFVFFRK